MQCAPLCGTAYHLSRRVLPCRALMNSYPRSAPYSGAAFRSRAELILSLEPNTPRPPVKRCIFQNDLAVCAARDTVSYLVESLVGRFHRLPHMPVSVLVTSLCVAVDVQRTLVPPCTVRFCVRCSVQGCECVHARYPVAVPRLTVPGYRGLARSRVDGPLSGRWKVTSTKTKFTPPSRLTSSAGQGSRKQRPAGHHRSRGASSVRAPLR